MENSIFVPCYLCNAFLQGIKYGVQHGIPEGLAKLFSQDTLIKIGLTQFQVDLYTKKLDMIISNAAVVSKILISGDY